MSRFSRNKLFLVHSARFGRIRWDESVAPTLMPTSVLFGKVTSSLKFEISLLKCIQGILSVLKLEHALLVYALVMFLEKPTLVT